MEWGGNETQFYLLAGTAAFLLGIFWGPTRAVISAVTTGFLKPVLLGLMLMALQWAIFLVKGAFRSHVDWIRNLLMPRRALYRSLAEEDVWRL